MKKHAAGTKIVAGLAAGVGSVNSATTRGRFVRLDDWDSLTIIATIPAVSNQGQTLSVRQATASSGGGPKAVTGIDFYASVAPASDTDAIGDAVERIADADDSGATAAGSAALIWCEVTADMLDVSGGYRWVQAQLARRSNAAQLGSIVYCLRSGRFERSPELADSVL